MSRSRLIQLFELWLPHTQFQKYLVIISLQIVLQFSSTSTKEVRFSDFSEMRIEGNVNLFFPRLSSGEYGVDGVVSSLIRLLLSSSSIGLARTIAISRTARNSPQLLRCSFSRRKKFQIKRLHEYEKQNYSYKLVLIDGALKSNLHHLLISTRNSLSF